MNKGLPIGSAPLVDELNGDDCIPVDQGNGAAAACTVDQIAGKAASKAATQVAQTVVAQSKKEAEAVMADALAGLNERMSALEK